MITLVKEYKRSILKIADMHFGSPYAPWPEGITSRAGVPIDPSPKQKILNGYLADLSRIADNFKCDSVFMYGDMIQGNNRKNYGKETMTTDLNVQVDAAEIALKPLTTGRDVIGILGTDYHDSLDAKMEQVLIEEKLGGICLGKLANVPLKGTNRIIQMVHGESSACIYREQVMAREGLFLWAAEGKQTIDWHVDMRVGGHWHFFNHMHSRKQHLLQLPGFMDWFPWKTGNLGKMLPDIGAVVLLIDKEDRMLPLPFLYPRPKIADDLQDSV